MRRKKEEKINDIKLEVYYYEEGTFDIKRLLDKLGNFVESPTFQHEKKIQSRFLYIISLIIFFFLSTFVTVNIFAEQIGSSPESGTDSKFTQLYDELVTLGIGSEGSGDWGDWGSRWNRIMSSSTRVFTPYARQSLQQRDDRDLTDWGDAGISTQTNTILGSEVWKDESSGLYWSNNRGGMTNESVTNTCDFFSTIPRGNYDGSDSTCGGAVNTCATLTLDKDEDGIEDTSWYLPSMIELYQAYVHGIYKKTNTAWVTTNADWSSTAYYTVDSYGWPISLHHGILGIQRPKSTSYSVRCVLRDLN